MVFSAQPESYIWWKLWWLWWYYGDDADDGDTDADYADDSENYADYIEYKTSEQLEVASVSAPDSEKFSYDDAADEDGNEIEHYNDDDNDDDNDDKDDDQTICEQLQAASASSPDSDNPFPARETTLSYQHYIFSHTTFLFLTL